MGEFCNSTLISKKLLLLEFPYSAEEYKRYFINKNL